MTPDDAAPRVVVTRPAWVESFVDWSRACPTDHEAMRLAIALARQNVDRGTGGPFGAVVVEQPGGRLVSVGTNGVVAQHNSILHAEVMAIMFAQQRLGRYSLALEPPRAHVLVTSCDPCAMCLGAALWSGVARLVTGAGREDAAAIGFDEGPVFPASYAYLEQRGVTVVRGVLREDAAAVMQHYRRTGGPIYNG